METLEEASCASDPKRIRKTPGSEVTSSQEVSQSAFALWSIYVLLTTASPVKQVRCLTHWALLCDLFKNMVMPLILVIEHYRLD